jgi:hypothetical protein
MTEKKWQDDEYMKHICADVEAIEKAEAAYRASPEYAKWNAEHAPAMEAKRLNYWNSLTPDELKMALHNRRIAAVHEAGHAVIARSLGCSVSSAYIYPSDESPQFWGGEVQRSDLWRVGVPPHLHPRQERMIGVAGVIAELSWEKAYSTGDELYYETDWEDRMSANDWATAGGELSCDGVDPRESPMRNAIKKVGRLLHRDGPLWGELILIARQLIVVSHRNVVRLPAKKTA